jgi:hypothetical protein
MEAGKAGRRMEMIVRMASVQVAPERIDKIVSHYREKPSAPYTSSRRDYATIMCWSTGTTVA